MQRASDIADLADKAGLDDIVGLRIEADRSVRRIDPDLCNRFAKRFLAFDVAAETGDRGMHNLGTDVAGDGVDGGRGLVGFLVLFDEGTVLRRVDTVRPVQSRAHATRRGAGSLDNVFLDEVAITRQWNRIG
jgi:hypothetical protein